MGMVFEAICDLRRWQSDRKGNNLKINRVILSSENGIKMNIEETISESLSVGDIIVLEN